MTPSSYPQCPILMVDDEPQTLVGYEMALRSANINQLIRCQESREVMGIFSSQEIEFMMLDLTMPHLSGEEILAMVIMDYPEVPVIIITGAMMVVEILVGIFFGSMALLADGIHMGSHMVNRVRLSAGLVLEPGQGGEARDQKD